MRPLSFFADENIQELLINWLKENDLMFQEFGLKSFSEWMMKL